MSLKKCRNMSDLRRRAKRMLPAPMFHFMDGGADDELSLRRNTTAFDDYEFIAHNMNDVSTIDTSRTVFGRKMALPFFLSPTGMSRLFHHDKELGVARAASKFDIFYALSTMGTTSIEEISNASSGHKMFQVYIFKDRGITKDLVQRCKAAGYETLSLTIDTPMAGNRERDWRTGMTIPPSFTLKSLLSFAASPEWVWNYARDSSFELANVVRHVDALQGGSMGVIDYVNSQFDRAITWKDVEWLADQWDGPLIVKGVQSPHDARKALESGATAIQISNHGGRQLDSSPAPVDLIRPVRDEVGDKLELIVDGGVRRGSHMVKALALGADACSIGRGYLYGLAAGGQAGVEKAIEILKADIERTMTLLGCASVDELSEKHIQHRPLR